MSKKKFLTLLLCIAVISLAYAQDGISPQLIKYSVIAPNGTKAITIYDDAMSTDMQLEAAQSFYKYELLDINTKQPVYARTNHGNRCTINKLKIVPGTYKLRLFTKNFIISSTVTISSTEKNTIAISD